MQRMRTFRRTRPPENGTSDDFKRTTPTMADSQGDLERRIRIGGRTFIEQNGRLIEEKDLIEDPRSDKRRQEIVDYFIAKKMIPQFGWHPWMSGEKVIGPNGERIPRGGIEDIISSKKGS